MRVGLPRVTIVTAAVAAVALLAMGTAGAAGHAQATLTLTVTGPGVVTGPGINCGNGNTDCSETYTAGVAVTLTAAAVGGAAFTGWGGGPCGGNPTSCSFTIDADTALAPTFSVGVKSLTLNVTGSGIVTGQGINCGSGNTDCSEVYATSAAVTLTATPLGGATFTGWGGACSGNATACPLTMSSDRAVTAVFTGSAGTATLTVTPTGSGRVTGPGIDCGLGATDCSESYATNTTVNLTATPGTGAVFSGWGGACTGAQTTCAVAMTTAKSVTAAFATATAQATLTVTVTGPGVVTGPGISCGNGNTDCSETYAVQTSVRLTASANSGAAFVGWAQTTPLITGFCGGGVLGPPPRTCDVVMSTSRAVTAQFSGSGTPPAPTGSFATKIGDPIVFTSASSKQATFHFFTSRAASAVMVESLNGSATSTFRFSPHAGDVLVGPFLLTSAGTYTFDLTLTDAAGNVTRLAWAVGGPGVFRPAVFLRNGGATVTRTGSGWIVHARFTAASPGAASVRVTYAGRTVGTSRFTFARGLVTITVPAREAGLHRIVMTARDARGRTNVVTWTVFLR